MVFAKKVPAKSTKSRMITRIKYETTTASFFGIIAAESRAIVIVPWQEYHERIQHVMERSSLKEQDEESGKESVE